MERLSFDQRACFIAGQAKSGTTLLAALLDNHPELLVLPQETAYFPTVLKKYGGAGRRAQFDYLTKQSFSRVLFGGEPKWREHEYKNFPQQTFLQTFDQISFDPANAQRDLLALMAAGEVGHPAVARGVAYLFDTQDRDGNWDEPWYTAVGFPRVFYLRYHGYRAFFPLWALARYRRLLRGNSRQVPFGI